MSTILDKIFQAKRDRVAAAKLATDVEELIFRARASRQSARRHSFRNAIETLGRVNVIAEFKRASPSKGIINNAADPSSAALVYEAGGAEAISVLTEEDFFQGSIGDLQKVRQSVSLPILRKDFFFDEYQIYESAVAGADAILLIVAALGFDDIHRLRSIAEDELGMDALVEAHTEEEMNLAAEAGATLIGVNNRNLKTFDVSLDVSRELKQFAPAEATLVAESGLRTHQDIHELMKIGYSGFLIGERLMRSSDVESTLRELVRYERCACS